jgi:DNA repair protein RadA/Sms
MSKIKTSYKCKSCGFVSAKWLGRCPDCQSWNTFEQVLIENTKPGTNIISRKSFRSSLKLEPTTIESILKENKGNYQKRVYPFISQELNEFWESGLSVGSLSLLAGEPGLGKSTLALQLLRSLHLGNKSDLKLIYFTAEESILELARRSVRLQIPPQILALQSNNFNQIEKVLVEQKPNVVIIDSIQTIFSDDLESSPGSVSQVSFLASQFMALTKELDISIILIGHVTKDGSVAGPKTLEHLVDSVILLESSKLSKYRTLGFGKHRFGSTDKQLLLKMEETGLQIITDPSLALLENLESGIGICYGIAIDKNLTMVTEIQALVGKESFGEGNFAKREALGLKVGKLNTILAICEKYLNINLKNRDVYVQIIGLPKTLEDDSMDLPILLAILSSIKEQEIEKFLKLANKNKLAKKKSIFAGRLTLSGKLRNSTNQETRQKTSQKLGFEFNPNIQNGDLNKAF